MYNRLSYFLPAGSFPWRPEITNTAAHFCIWPANNTIIPRVHEANPGAQIWCSMSPALVRCRTSGGRYAGRIPWRDDQKPMPDVVFTEEVFKNQWVPGMLTERAAGGQVYWPEVQPDAIGCNLVNGPQLQQGRFRGKHAIEAYVELCDEFFATPNVSGLHFDVSPRTMGFPANDDDLAPLRALYRHRDRITVVGVHQDPAAWPGAFSGATPWASGLKVEGGPFTAPRAYLPRAEEDLWYAMWDGSEYGMPTLGLANNATATTVWHCEPRYRFQAENEQLLTLAVGMFCLAMSNPDESGSPRGPWLSMHDTYWGDTQWPGIYAPEREELRRWTQLRALTGVHRISSYRIFTRVLEDDGGQKYTMNVSFETSHVTGHPPMTARLVRRN